MIQELETSEPLRARKVSQTADEAREKKRARDRGRINQITATKNEVGQLPPCLNLSQADWCKDLSGPELRQLCIDSLQTFLEVCFPNLFFDPFGEVQVSSIEHEERMIRRGAGFINKLEPRGYGKSTRSILAAVWGALCGHQDFTMICCDSKEKAEDLIKMATTALRENQILLGLFPEVYPFHKISSSHGCQYQTYQGRKTKIDFRGDTIYFPVLDGTHASESRMIVARPFKKARGKNIEGRRPSHVILDDVQSTEDAMSPTAPRKLIKFLTTDIAKLGTSQNPCSITNNATIIADQDYASLVCDLKAFTTVRYKMVNTFPDDYEKGGGLWVEYLKIRQDYDDNVVGDDERSKSLALDFYQSNREAMDVGESVTWSYAYSRKESAFEISTIQSAINFIQDWGRPAFNSECQNEAEQSKTLEGFLTAKELAKKQHPYGRQKVPHWADMLVAYVDIQQEMLIWKIWAFTKDGFTGGNIEFSSFPKQPERYWTKKSAKNTLEQVYETTTLEARQKQAIIDLTDDLCAFEFTREGDGMAMQIKMIGIDARYQTETVKDAYRDSKNKGRIQLCMGQFFGVKTKPQRHRVVKPKSGSAKGFGWFLAAAVQGIQILEMDSNRLKTFVHQRFATSLNDPGSFSLWEDDTSNLEMAADHLSSEYFERLSGPYGEVDEWSVKPGRPDNDGFDCDVGCVAIASLQGAKMTGTEEREDGRKKRKRVDGSKWGKK